METDCGLAFRVNAERHKSVLLINAYEKCLQHNCCLQFSKLYAVPLLCNMFQPIDHHHAYRSCDKASTTHIEWLFGMCVYYALHNRDETQSNK